MSKSAKQPHQSQLNKDPEAAKFQLLVNSHLLTPEALEAAVKEARESGESAASILMNKNHVSKDSIGYALNAHYRLSFVGYDPNFQPPADAARGVNPASMKANGWVPLRTTGDSVHVLTDDPGSSAKVAMIRQLFPGKKLKLYVGLKEDIEKYVDSIGARRAAAAGALAGALPGPAAAQTSPAPAARPRGRAGNARGGGLDYLKKRPGLALALVLTLLSSLQYDLLKGPSRAQTRFSPKPLPFQIAALGGPAGAGGTFWAPLPAALDVPVLPGITPARLTASPDKHAQARGDSGSQGSSRGGPPQVSLNSNSDISQDQAETALVRADLQADRQDRLDDSMEIAGDRGAVRQARQAYDQAADRFGDDSPQARAAEAALDAAQRALNQALDDLRHDARDIRQDRKELKADLRDLRQDARQAEPSPRRLGQGELSDARALASAAGVPAEDILARREDGLGWGEIARELGTTLGNARKAFAAGLDRQIRSPQAGKTSLRTAERPASRIRSFEHHESGHHESGEH